MNYQSAHLVDWCGYLLNLTESHYALSTVLQNCCQRFCDQPEDLTETLYGYHLHCLKSPVSGLTAGYLYVFCVLVERSWKTCSHWIHD